MCDIQLSTYFWSGSVTNGRLCVDAEPRVLPAVRVPVKGIELPAVSREKGSSQAVEGWIEEARKEAGISKPFTVRLSYCIHHTKGFVFWFIMSHDIDLNVYKAFPDEN